MVFGLGLQELLIILLIVLFVFGAGRLPEIGSAIGKSIKDFKRVTKGLQEKDPIPPGQTDEKEETK